MKLYINYRRYDKISENGEVHSNFRKILIKHLCEKGDKSERDN